MYQVQLRLRRLIRALDGGKQAALVAEAQGLLRQLQLSLRSPRPFESVSPISTGGAFQQLVDLKDNNGISHGHILGVVRTDPECNPGLAG